MQLLLNWASQDVTTEDSRLVRKARVSTTACLVSAQTTRVVDTIIMSLIHRKVRQRKLSKTWKKASRLCPYDGVARGCILRAPWGRYPLQSRILMGRMGRKRWVHVNPPLSTLTCSGSRETTATVTPPILSRIWHWNPMSVIATQVYRSCNPVLRSKWRISFCALLTIGADKSLSLWRHHLRRTRSY